MARGEERPAPPVTVGLLGAPGCGRTTLLLAAIGSSEDSPVRLVASLATQRRELAGRWRRLVERGEAPPHPIAGDELALRIEVDAVPTPLVVNDLDRGGRGTEAATDTVVVLLDGGVLGSWIAEAGDDPANADTSRVQNRLGVGLLSGRLLAVARARRAADRPAPSVAVVVTKADAYGSPTPSLNHLRRVVPACFDPSMLTMVSAATVPTRPGATAVPQGVLAPFAFAELVRLSAERVVARSAVNNALTRTWGTNVAVDRQREFIEIRQRAAHLVAELARWVVVRGDDEVAWPAVAGRSGR